MCVWYQFKSICSRHCAKVIHCYLQCLWRLRPVLQASGILHDSLIYFMAVLGFHAKPCSIRNPWSLNWPRLDQGLTKANIPTSLSSESPSLCIWESSLALYWIFWTTSTRVQLVRRSLKHKRTKNSFSSSIETAFSEGGTLALGCKVSNTVALLAQRATRQWVSALGRSHLVESKLRKESIWVNDRMILLRWHLLPKSKPTVWIGDEKSGHSKGRQIDSNLKVHHTVSVCVCVCVSVCVCLKRQYSQCDLGSTWVLKLLLDRIKRPIPEMDELPSLFFPCY